MHHQNTITSQLLASEKEYETKRKKLRNRRISCFYIAAVLVIFSIFLLINTSGPNNATAALFQLSILLALVVGAYAYNIPKSFVRGIKSSLYPHIFKAIGARYAANKVANLQTLKRQSLIVPEFHKYETTDFIDCTYKDIEISIFHTELFRYEFEVVFTGRHMERVFSGIFILLTLPTSSAAKTILKKDDGNLSNWLDNVTTPLKRVKITDPLFEKQFEVYSTDQVEARCTLTPDVIEHIAQLSRLLGAETIECSFFDNKVLIIAETYEKMFEPTSFNIPVSFERDIEAINAEMKQIKNIIDLLKLAKR